MIFLFIVHIHCTYTLYLNIDNITFPSCLGGRELNMIPKKNMIKFPPLPIGKKIRYLRKVHIFSSFPTFAFSFIGREFEKS